MKTKIANLLCACVVLVFLCTGCSENQQPVVIQEGVIFTVQWTDGTGRSQGMSRLNLPQSVPGGNGSWNMDLYGRLFPTHLEMVNRQVKDLGPQIIPIQRLDYVQFGTGGITFPIVPEKK